MDLNLKALLQIDFVSKHMAEANKNEIKHFLYMFLYQRYEHQVQASPPLSIIINCWIN